MNAYVDYEYYIDTYKGNMPEADFEKLVIRASTKIKMFTFDRININSIQNEVKYCTCLITDKLKEYANKSTDKKSESVGSWSVTYQDNMSKEQDKEIENIINEYLWNVCDEDGTPLIYRGC